MRAIFISYRREDSEGHAGRLFEDLTERFGSGAVFMDVVDIEPGRDFRHVIEKQVAECGVLLAVIGRDWLGVTDAQGQRRLDDPADFVRLETANALKRDIPVIPVLVHGATMPRAEALPDELKDLAYRNSVELTHARWPSDVQVLIGALLAHVDARPAGDAQPRPRLAAGPTPALATARKPWTLIAAAVALVAAGAGYALWQRGQMPELPARPTNAAPTLGAASLPPAVAVPPAAVPSTAALAAPPVPRQDTAAARPVPVPDAAAPDAAAAEAAPAPPPPRPAGLELLGSPADIASAARTIVIRPRMGNINVDAGEIVRFDVGGRSFAWNFNGRRHNFDLSLVAPPGTLERRVIVNVKPAQPPLRP